MTIFWFLLLPVVIVLGLAFGSFATAAVDRLPRGESWLSGPTRCSMCKTRLKLKDYFSIVSYFTTNGKCRYCHKKFPNHKKFLYTEIAVLLSFIIAYFQSGFISSLFLLRALLYSTMSAMIIAEYFQKQIASSFVTIALVLAILLHQSLSFGNFSGLVLNLFLGAVIGIILRGLMLYRMGRKVQIFDFVSKEGHERFQVELIQVVYLFAMVPLLSEKFIGFVAFTFLIFVLTVLYKPKFGYLKMLAGLELIYFII